ncbi:MAG: serine/threonine protein kinase, partial [Acidobacteria bacterium]|nr:serine/threonine protein kinase [Acidobacteriota bacterium]
EYVDGEDLASLLRRIGRLPHDKGVQVGRQLCAGLAAAHEKGVLHRDLKPANIMIDGHGRVRITDFGLAIVGEDEAEPNRILGTPAYMAPEQFAGKGASVRSDIYALGLTLYEITSGKRAFTAPTIAELREQKDGSSPTAPSDIRPGLDPVVERVVMRCMEKDPRARPGSVVQIAMALPGGDPLAAAIAAGETPSPEMVAASGLKEGLRPAVAWGLLAFVIIGTFAVVQMSKSTELFRRVTLSKPPDALVERAREFLKKAGYSDAVDSASGFAANEDFLRYVQDKSKTGVRNNLDAGAVDFWYRQSPRPLERIGFVPSGPAFWGVTSTDPPQEFSGEALVRLDTEGRLRSLRAIPTQRESSGGPPAPGPDWALVFSEAGLDVSLWTPAEPEWNPLYYADVRAAWQGSLPKLPNIPVRIEAAAYRGKPVNFEIVGPWTRESRMVPYQATTLENGANLALVLIFATILGGGLFFARKNLRLGRGDRRGATRLALVVLCLEMIAWFFGEHHVTTFYELGLFVMFLGWGLFFAALIWVLYIALEPFVRRGWPQILVSWTRVLAGEWRDPLVGRDVLIGCAVGVTLRGIIRLSFLLPLWFGYPEEMPIPLVLTTLSGTNLNIPAIIDCVMPGLFNGFGSLFLFCFLRVLLRKEWLAAVAVILVLSLPDILASQSPLIAAPVMVAFGTLNLLVIVRVGLAAAVTAFFTFQILLKYPMTFDASAWYAGIGFTGFFVLAAVAIFGFRTSLGNQSALNVPGLEG